jgi:hypothetical protein
VGKPAIAVMPSTPGTQAIAGSQLQGPNRRNSCRDNITDVNSRMHSVTAGMLAIIGTSASVSAIAGMPASIRGVSNNRNPQETGASNSSRDFKNS